MNHSTAHYDDTSLEGDPLAEIDEELWEREAAHRNTLQICHAVLDILKLVVCLTIIAVQLFLAITILRFKRLRTRTNMYILNMCLMSIMFYFVVPMSVLLLEKIFSYTVHYLYLMETQHIILVLYLSFAIGLALDWFVSGFKPSLIDKYDAYFRYISGGLYSIFMLYWIVFVVTTDEDYHLLQEDKFKHITGLYCVYLVVLVVINLLKKRIIDRSDCVKTAYALTVSNIVLFSFILIYIYVFMIYLSRFSNTFAFDVLILILDPIFLLLPIGHPILVMYVLGKENKYFKMAYRRTFKRSVRNYTEDDLDDVSVADNAQNNRVSVNFANANEHGDNNVLVI